uniref:transposase n=1 Tax=Shigella flexneri TaxID=623 RepID=UPI0025B689A5
KYTVADAAKAMDVGLSTMTRWVKQLRDERQGKTPKASPITPELNRPGFPGECFICELRLPDHRFRWKHNKLFLLLPEGCGPAFP